MESENNTIYFYDTADQKTKEEHIFLNNFDVSPFVSKDGLKYLTVEHYYQAKKFADFSKDGFKEIYEEIRNAPNADTCKKASRKYTKSINEEIWNKSKWDSSLKDYYMKRALTYKFSQNKDLLERLLKTKDSKLVEESYKDPYWGGMLEGSKNMLGNMLMELRDNYNKTKTVFLSGSDLDPINIEL